MGRAAPPRTLADAFERLPDLGHPSSARTLEVRASDLDINRHANNVSVIGWLLEPLTGADEMHDLAELEVEFRGEAQGGERVRSEAVEGAGGAFLHRVARETDGREIARARSRWRPR